MLVVKVMLHWKNKHCLSVPLAVVRLSPALVPQCCRQVLTAHVLLPHLSLWKRWCGITGSSRQSYVEQAYPITHMRHYSILVMDKNQYGEPKPLVILYMTPVIRETDHLTSVFPVPYWGGRWDSGMGAEKPSTELCSPRVSCWAGPH